MWTKPHVRPHVGTLQLRGYPLSIAELAFREYIEFLTYPQKYHLQEDMEYAMLTEMDSDLALTFTTRNRCLKV
jgi:hypothetical protein